MRNVAIPGLGQIGRLVLRHYRENLRLTAANSPTSLEERRVCAAAEATVPTIPWLKGKMHTIAIRVPISDGAVSEIGAHPGRQVTAEYVTITLKNVAANEMNNILPYCEDDLVSADIIGYRHSAIIDASSTAVIGGRVVEVLVWYDNEWRYARRLLDLASYMTARRPDDCTTGRLWYEHYKIYTMV